MLTRTVKGRNAMEMINDIRQDGDRKCFEVLECFRMSKLTPKEAKRAKDKNDFTLLHYVMFYGKGKGVLQLVQHLVYLYPDSVKATTKMGNLAIHLMPQFDGKNADRSKILNDQLAARLFLIGKHPAGLRALDSDGFMPLFRAIRYGYNATARAIVETFPEAAKIQNSHGQIPLHLSLDMLDVDTSLVEKLLYNYPAGFRLLDNAGKSPLGNFLLRGNEETLEWKKQIIATIAKAAPDAFQTACRQEKLFNDLVSNIRHQVCVVSPRGNSSVKNQGDQSEKNVLSSEDGVAYSQPDAAAVTQKVEGRGLLEKNLLVSKDQVASSQSEVAALKQKVKELTEEREEIEKKLADSQDQVAARTKDHQVAKAKVAALTKQVAKLDGAEQARDDANRQAVAFITEQNLNMRLFHAARKSERILLSKIDGDWSIPDLQGTLQSLIHRINDLKDTSIQNAKRSIPFKFAQVSTNSTNAEREDLMDLIEALNKELLELESFADNASRKRARLSPPVDN
jgi:hypothetical protein